MNTKLTIIISIIIIILSLVFGAIVYDKMPAQMASHWGTNDQVDGYTGKFWGVFMMPILSVGMLALFLIVPYLDPLKENIADFRDVFNSFILMFVFFLGYVWALTIFWNLGFTSFNMSAAILPAMGLLFFFIGYIFREAKRNWFIGIRTPWTLSSDAVWDEIHRLGATLFMASGLIAMLGAFFRDYAVWFLLIPLLGTTLFLYVYSYILYQQEEKIAK